MVASIPASSIVTVNPNVISAGGTGLDLSGLILTTSGRVPIGVTLGFPSPASVASFFGPSSQEAALANRYFAGFDGSAIKPAELLFSQYPTADVPAYLRGGNVSALTLAQLRAIAGVLTVTINGVDHVSSALDLSAVGSFSAAATAIQTALAAYDATFTATVAGTLMTVTGSPVGELAVGQIVEGVGIDAGTVIQTGGTGTGGAGTYQLSTAATIPAATSLKSGAAVVSYDSVSGAFVVRGGTPGAISTIEFATGGPAAPLGLTAVTGAIISVGADATSPADAMAAVTAYTQNFVSFMTAFKPSTDDMVAFATWSNAQNNRFLYVAWDNDGSVTLPDPVASFGARARAASLSGYLAIYDPTDGPAKAAFVMGDFAAIDFSKREGRTNLAFRKQSGLLAGVTNEAIAEQLLANGYNFYGSYATANSQFTFFYNGQVGGPFKWADSFINQVWMNNNFQLALMILLTSAGSIPYNAVGRALIEQAMADTINTAVDFGAIRAGVQLSGEQIAQVNAIAGKQIDTVLSQRGWYLLVGVAAAQVRAARGSPPVTFFYTDGGSVQKISLNSVEVA